MKQNIQPMSSLKSHAARQETLALLKMIAMGRAQAFEGKALECGKAFQRIRKRIKKVRKNELL